MKDNKSIFEKDYELVRNTVLYSLLPNWIKGILTVVLILIIITSLSVMIRQGVLMDVLSPFGTLFGSIFDFIGKFFELLIYGVTGHCPSDYLLSNGTCNI